MLFIINTFVDCYQGARRLSPGAVFIATSCITFCSSAMGYQPGNVAPETYDTHSIPVASSALVGDGTAGNANGTANFQCLESEWQGQPLVARYRVTNHTVKKG